MPGVDYKFTRSFAVFFLAMVVLYTAVVLFVYIQAPVPFHGLIPAMPRNVIIGLRTGLAGLAILLFVPIVWGMSRRGEAKSGDASAGKITLLLLTLAEMPALCGLLLFFLKGAFKTYFVFLAVTAVYYVIVWPRKPAAGK